MVFQESANLFLKGFMEFQSKPSALGQDSFKIFVKLKIQDGLDGKAVRSKGGHQKRRQLQVRRVETGHTISTIKYMSKFSPNSANLELCKCIFAINTSTNAQI